MRASPQARKAARAAYKHAAATSKPGEGGRFKALEAEAKASGARDPGAVAAAAGRKKYGKAKFQAMAAAGKKH
jgi:hypothetical protein